MNPAFIRTEALLGKDAMIRLQNSRVLVFGVGGVGGFAVEALARSGVGSICIVDSDVIDISNINRQLIALHSTVGESKVSVLAARLLDINPALQVQAVQTFVTRENVADFFEEPCDYIVDCVDTVTAKVAIIEQAHQRGIPVISAMGCGNKLDPGRLEISLLSKTSIDPLARVMRREMRQRGIHNVKVVYSKELPITPHFSVGSPADTEEENGGFRKQAPASIAFVPSVAGLMLAAEAVKDLAHASDKIKDM